jgi:cytidine deaminase
MTNKELIQKAASLIKAKETKGGLCGDVGAIVISQDEKVFTGICAATGSNVFCAEQIALGTMVASGEYKFKKVVAVWKDEEENIFVIPPCGNCRQYMRELDEENLNSEIVLNKDKTVKLKELLPYYDWCQKQ